jgi:pilus assembly protein CpaE
MFQIFSRSVRKARRILDIGFVTQDMEVGRQLKEFVSQREGVSLRLLASEKVASGFDAAGLSVFVYDLNASTEPHMREFERFMAQRPAHLPVIVLSPAVDDELLRWLLRLRVADWIKTPLSPGELIAACGRVITQTGSARQEVKCITFTGARGGVGTTSIAVHAALLSARGKPASNSTCLVDLDLTAGACAEYLDLQPTWALDEILADPSRLDNHMLEIMTAAHPQGIGVLSARRRFGEGFAFAPEVITRTLDLASQRFQTLVVDLPRHAESWSDGVILGSSDVFVVTDFSVPGLKTARRMVNDIQNQYGGEVTPKVIVNRFSRSLFGTGLSASEVKELLGESLAGYVSAEDRLLREAIDRGIPTTDIKARNAFVSDIAKIVGY